MLSTSINIRLIGLDREEVLGLKEEFEDANKGNWYKDNKKRCLNLLRRVKTYQSVYRKVGPAWVYFVWRSDWHSDIVYAFEHDRKINLNNVENSRELARIHKMHTKVLEVKEQIGGELKEICREARKIKTKTGVCIIDHFADKCIKRDIF